jgi:hypothetical protein
MTHSTPGAFERSSSACRPNPDVHRRTAPPTRRGRGRARQPSSGRGARGRRGLCPKQLHLPRASRHPSQPTCPPGCVRPDDAVPCRILATVIRLSTARRAPTWVEPGDRRAGGTPPLSTSRRPIASRERDRSRRAGRVDLYGWNAVRSTAWGRTRRCRPCRCRGRSEPSPHRTRPSIPA